MFFPRQSFRAAFIAGLGLALAAAGLFSALPAKAQEKVGLLECNVSPGVGYVITSSRALACRFTPAQGGRPEYYVGTINQFGLDLGVTGPGQLVWGVFAPSAGLRHHVLAGRYVGATAEASLGAGLGANALVGGSDRTIALQPLSINAQTGINLAAGVADLTLEPAPRPHR